MNNVEVKYIDVDNKLVREILRKGDEEKGFSDFHIVTFYKCNGKSKKVLEYMRKKHYVFHECGLNKDGTRYISVGRAIPLMSKEEREQLEARFIMIKLTQ